MAYGYRIILDCSGIASEVKRITIEHRGRLTRSRFRAIERVFRDIGYTVELLGRFEGRSGHEELAKNTPIIIVSFSPSRRPMRTTDATVTEVRCSCHSAMD